MSFIENKIFMNSRVDQVHAIQERNGELNSYMRIC